MARGVLRAWARLATWPRARSRFWAFWSRRALSSAATGAISVTYRAYLGDDYGTVVDLIEGLKLKRATVAAATVDGELSFEEIATQAFPRRTYDLDTYGALWNA